MKKAIKQIKKVTTKDKWLFWMLLLQIPIFLFTYNFGDGKTVLLTSIPCVGYLIYIFCKRKEYIAIHWIILPIASILVVLCETLSIIDNDMAVLGDLIAWYILILGTEMLMWLLRASLSNAIPEKDINYNIGISMLMIILGYILFLRLISMNSGWTYFTAILAFFLVFFDPVVFATFFSKSKIQSKIKFSTQKKIYKIKIWIAAIPVFAAIVQMLLPIGKITYSIFDSNSNSTTPIFGSKALKEAFQEVGYVTWTVFSVAYIIFVIMLIFILFSGIKSKFNNKKNVGYENNKISLGERIIFLKLFTELLNELKSDDIEKNKKAGI